MRNMMASDFAGTPSLKKHILLFFYHSFRVSSPVSLIITRYTRSGAYLELFDQYMVRMPNSVFLDGEMWYVFDFFVILFVYFI